jgi:hypothetical protein
MLEKASVVISKSFNVNFIFSFKNLIKKLFINNFKGFIS